MSIPNETVIINPAKSPVDLKGTPARCFDFPLVQAIADVVDDEPIDPAISERPQLIQAEVGADNMQTRVLLEELIYEGGFTPPVPKG